VVVVDFISSMASALSGTRADIPNAFLEGAGDDRFFEEFE
jgi:hypothetical protein